MHTEEEYRQGCFIDDDSEFEAKLIQLYGKNYLAEAKITFAVCMMIDSYQEIMSILNAGDIKIEKKRAEDIKAALKNFYQTRSQKRCSVLKDADGIITLEAQKNDLKDKINRDFQTMAEFRTDYLENAELIQQVLQNGQDYAHEIFKKKEIRDICLRQPLHIKLSKEVEYIIRCFYPNNIDLIEAAEQFSQTLDFQCIQTAMISTVNESNKLRIINIIQRLRSFVLLEEFGGEEIESLKHNFKVEFQEHFCNVLPFSLRKALLGQLLKNPEYNWTNRKDINEDQNQKLIAKLWLEQNSLLKLMKAFKAKETLDNRIKKQVKTIINFISNTCKINLGAEELETTKKYLTTFNLVGFFDQNTSINASMKKIYDFMSKDCPNYMKAAINKEKCSVGLRTQKQMLLKKKLYDKIEYFSYKNWSELQDQILKGNANIIDKYIHDEDVRYELSVWIRTTMEDYYAIILKTETLKSQATSELMTFLINQNIKNLDYKDIVNIKDKLLTFPYEDYIQTNTKICFEDQSKIRRAFPKLKVLNEYRKSKKIELSVLRQQAGIKIEPAINLLNHQSPISIPTTLKKKLIDAFLENPFASSIYEQSYVPESYRRDFMAAVSKIDEVKRYIEDFNRMSCIEKENKLIEALSQFVKPSDIETLKAYMFVFGEVPISNDGKFNVELKDQRYEELGLLMKCLSPEDRRRLKEFESSQVFQSFKEDLSVISDLYKNQCWQKFLLLVERLIISKQLPEKQQKDLINVFNSKMNVGSDRIFSDEKLSSQRYSNLKLTLSNEPKYQHLVLLEDSIKQNKKFFMELKLKKKIRSAYHHDSLITLSKEDKKSMIMSLQKGYKAEIIAKNTKLTDDSKKQLINYIEQSHQFKEFYKIPAQNVPPSRNIPQPPLPSPVRANVSRQLDPEKKEFEAPKEKAAIVIQQAIFEESRTPVIPVARSSPVVLPEAQLYTNANQQFLAKWDKMLVDSKPRSQYKMARENEFKQNPLKLVDHILKSYPWNEEKINFWSAANGNGKAFMKRALVSQLNQFVNSNEALKEEIMNFQNQA